LVHALQKGWLIFADTALKCVQITKSFFTMHENKQIVEARPLLCLSGLQRHGCSTSLLCAAYDDARRALLPQAITAESLFHTAYITGRNNTTMAKALAQRQRPQSPSKRKPSKDSYADPECVPTSKCPAVIRTGSMDRGNGVYAHCCDALNE
jgi:hypothetical protein